MPRVAYRESRMVEDVSQNPLLAAAWWKEVRALLKSSVEFGDPILWRSNARRKEGQAEALVVPARVVVRNTAQSTWDGLEIVFTGITLRHVYNEVDLDRDLSSWLRDKRNVRLPSGWRGQASEHDDQVYGGVRFPRVTDDERRHGVILFPGEAVTFEVSVPAAAKDTVQFIVGATLSRRHLFHFEEAVRG